MSYRNKTGKTIAIGAGIVGIVLMAISCTQKNVAQTSHRDSHVISIEDHSSFHIDGASTKSVVEPYLPVGLQVTSKISKSGDSDTYQLHLFWTYDGKSPQHWFVRPLNDARPLDRMNIEHDDYFAFDDVAQPEPQQHSIDIKGLDKNKIYQLELGAALSTSRTLPPEVDIFLAEKVYKLIKIDLTDL